MERTTIKKVNTLLEYSSAELFYTKLGNYFLIGVAAWLAVHPIHACDNASLSWIFGRRRGNVEQPLKIETTALGWVTLRLFTSVMPAFVCADRSTTTRNTALALCDSSASFAFTSSVESFDDYQLNRYELVRFKSLIVSLFRAVKQVKKDKDHSNPTTKRRAVDRVPLSALSFSPFSWNDGIFLSNKPYPTGASHWNSRQKVQLLFPFFGPFGRLKSNSSSNLFWHLEEIGADRIRVSRWRSHRSLKDPLQKWLDTQQIITNLPSPSSSTFPFF